jgi:predicted ATPase
MGKTTLLGDCARAFPDFECETEAYRSLRSFNPNLHIGLGREADKHAMWILQGNLMGKLMRHRKGDKVFFDRGPADMLAYSLYAWEEKQTDLDDGFLQSLRDIACIYCREFLDAILFVPIRQDYAITFEDDGVRPTDDGYASAWTTTSSASTRNSICKFPWSRSREPGRNGSPRLPGTSA